jgi:hypothetical protein
MHPYRTMLNAFMIIKRPFLNSPSRWWFLQKWFVRHLLSGHWENCLKRKMWKIYGKLSGEKRKIRRLQDICRDDVNEIYTALSGDPITQARFWDQPMKHSKRRNALVHTDHTGPTAHPIPSLQDSDESFKAVEDCIQHVHEILASI